MQCTDNRIEERRVERMAHRVNDVWLRTRDNRRGPPGMLDREDRIVTAVNDQHWQADRRELLSSQRRRKLLCQR